MANLYSGVLNTNGEHKKLATLTGVTFTTNTVYTIQGLNPFYVRVGTTGKGFYVFDGKPFQFKKDADDIYILTEGGCYFNIAN